MKLSKEVINYIIFGVLTTIVNIVIYAVLMHIVHTDYKIAVIAAWFTSVLFAFVTNKIYVFNSKNLSFPILVREFTSFMFFRIISLGMDLGMMIIFIEWLNLDDLLSKITINVFVVIFNYIVSKYSTFSTGRKKGMEL